MKIWLRIAAFLLLAWTASAWGQGDGGQTPPDGSAAVERVRIDAVRQQKTVELDAEDAACLSKFAVTDCQSKVGTRRRQMLADLKRQEANINAIERRQKVAEQAQKTQEKSAEGAQRERDMHVGTKKTTEEERQKSLDEKVLNHKNQAKLSEAPTTKSTSKLDAAAVEKNRAAHQDKLTELEKRRQERDKRLKDHPASGPPLPVAPL
jgi:glucan-binding YG repeat protein